MEISMRMVPTTSKLGLKQKPYNNKYRVEVRGISCRADNLTVQRGKPNFYELLSLGHSENLKKNQTKRFLELQMAYETLSDPVSRKMHDCELGLADQIGFGVRNCCMWERRWKFPRDVWEKQVDGLKKRSQFRLQRMKNRYGRMEEVNLSIGCTDGVAFMDSGFTFVLQIIGPNRGFGGRD
ncbi:hypothetical protein Gorai_009281 [Gossypium raimondii]|uniref:J domain-containing protein n=1 Tax=Gossypium raimondii TaxID=29730 RepID=A0A7J8PSX4_GOSRA|nr:hypothetical protein [Gossypium raimondii]